MADDAPAPPAAGSNRLAVLLAMAMFVLVVDTSLMNVSISAVVHDLDTTVSGVQSAIALEALVSAAFILIGSKVGDLIGRKRAYVLGLLGYAVGALAMALAQSLTAIIIFWAIIGGLGASLLLPAMQSLIHGNFEGAAQKKAYALVGAAAAIAAAVGPLLGGFITTYLSWRVAFLLEDVDHRRSCCPASSSSATCPTPARAQIDLVGAVLSVVGMGGIVLGILVWQEGGEAVGALLVARRGRRWPALVWWLVRRKREGKPTLIDPDLFKAKLFRFGISGADAPADRARRHDDRAADLPADGARVQRDAGRPVARAAVAEHVRGRAARREAGRQAPPEQHHPRRVRARSPSGMVVLIPIVPRADSGWYLVDPAGRSRARAWACWCRSSTTTRSSPISEERVSEAAGVNSAAGSFGLSFGLGVRRRDHARDALVHLHPHGRGQHRAPRRPSSSRSRTRSSTTPR